MSQPRFQRFGGNVRTDKAERRRALRQAIDSSAPTVSTPIVELLEDRRLMTAVYWTGGSGHWDVSTHDWRLGSPTGRLVAWGNGVGYDAVIESSNASITVAANINVRSIEFAGAGDKVVGAGTKRLQMIGGKAKSSIATGTIRVDAGNSATIPDQIIGTGGITVVGSGSLHLETATGYAGSTTVNGATVYLDANQITTTVAKTKTKTNSARPLVINSGTVVVDAPTALVSTLNTNPAVTVNTGGTLTTGPGVSVQLRTLSLRGGTLASGANGNWNFLSAGVSVTASSVVTATGMVGTSAWWVSPGVTATVSGSFGGSASTPSVVSKTGNGTLLLTGNDAPSTGAPTFGVAAGSLQIGDGTNAGVIPANTLVDSSVVTFDEPASFGYSGAITGSGAVYVAGGNISFTSANTYAGGTNVSGGTLTVDAASGSAVGSGTVVVDNGGRLAGTGQIAGPVVVQSGGTIATDDALSTGPLTLSTGATAEVDAGSSGGKFTVIGAATLNNATLVVNGNPTASAGAGYDIISANGGLTGVFANAAQSAQVNFGQLVGSATYLTDTVHLAAANNSNVIPNPVPVIPAVPTVSNTGVVIAWTASNSVSVTVTSASGDVPTGTVTLLDRSTVISTATLTVGGATLSASTLGVGTHLLSVAYSGDSLHAASVSVRMVRVVPPLQPTLIVVSSLSSTAVSGTEIDLVWTATSTDGTRLSILRSTGTATGSVINTVAGTATTFRDTGLIPGVTYSYQIVPVGQTTNSNKTSSTTPLPAPAYVGPSVEPVYPSGFATFAAPVSATSTSDAGSPQFDEYTRTANADDSLAITAESLTNATFGSTVLNGAGAGFVAYGQTTNSNGILTDAPIQTLSGQAASVTLPASLPGGSLYLVWARNTDANGVIHYSQPIVINQPNIWWVDSGTSIPGGVVTVYGRNLSQNPAGGSSADHSWVYLLNNVTGAGQWISVTNAATTSPDVNPNRVDFTLPSSITPGAYTVWVNNGLAGSYSWSNSTQLTVTAPVSIENSIVYQITTIPTEQMLNQTIGQGVFLRNLFDDTGEVFCYLPSGTITLTSPLMIPDYVHLVGNGHTVFNVPANSGWEYAVDMSWLDTSLEGISIVADNGAIAQHPANSDGRLSAVVELESGSQLIRNVTISDVNPDAAAAPDVNSSYQNSGLRILGSTFIGPGIVLSSVDGAVISGCTFIGAGGGDAVVAISHAYNFSFSDSIVQNLSNDPSLFYSSAARVLWISTAGEDVYVGNVTSVGLFPEAVISSGLNGGEQILSESSETQAELNPTAAANLAGIATLSFTTASVIPGVGWSVTVGSGPGLGQTRIVTAVTVVDNTVVLTLDEPWNVAPTPASLVSVGTTIDKFAVYGNHLSGDGVQSFTGNTAGVQVGGNNIVIDDNTITGVVTGVGLWTVDKYQGENAAPCDFDLIANNTISNVMFGIRSVTESTSLGETIALQTGDVWRLNTISNVHQVAVYGDLPTAISFSEWVAGPAGQVFGNVIEHNTVTAPIGLTITPGGNQAPAANGAVVATLVRGNTFTSDGSAGATAILSTVTETGYATLTANTFNGFAQTVNPAVSVSSNWVIVPNRSLAMTIAAGSTATTSLLIESATLSTAAWAIDASTLPSWVSLSTLQGTTDPVTGQSMVTITLNAAAVTAGTYTLKIPVLIGGVDVCDVIIALDVAA